MTLPGKHKRIHVEPEKIPDIKEVPSPERDKETPKETPNPSRPKAPDKVPA